MKILIVLSLLFVIVNFAQSSESECSLVIAKNKFASLMGGDNTIYNKGKKDPSYDEKSPIIHQSPEGNDIDYLYLTEHITDKSKTYRNVTFSIESTNASFASPKVNLIETSNTTDQVKSHQLEVIYNCNKTSDGIVLIKLIINAMDCSPIELFWQKFCKGDQIKHTPNINLGFKSGNHDIIQNGVIQKENFNMFQSERNDNGLQIHVINDDMVHFYISSAELSQNVKLNQFTISPVNSNIVSPVIVGDITKGGEIKEHEEKDFYIFFTCHNNKGRYDTSETFTLDIPFEDNHIISLSFSKVCPVMQKSFFSRMFKFFYWCLLITLIGMLYLFIYFHFSNGGDIDKNIMNELYKAGGTIKDYVSDKIRMSTPSKKEIEEVEDIEESGNDNNDENDVLNIKITTRKEDALDQAKIDNNQDYGGI